MDIASCLLLLHYTMRCTELYNDIILLCVLANPSCKKKIEEKKRKQPTPISEHKTPSHLKSFLAMSIFKRKRKKKKNSDTDSTNLSYDSVSASPGSRRGSISESIVSFGSSGSPPGSIVKAHWKLLVGAQESTWRSRASLLIGNDLLLLGAHEASVENTDPPMQLYFCDTTRKVWSTSVLKGKGPGYSIFYAALAFPFSTERLFVFWPCPQRGRVARMMQSFEAKKV